MAQLKFLIFEEIPLYKHLQRAVKKLFTAVFNPSNGGFIFFVTYELAQ